jgi:hypothetical protein
MTASRLKDMMAGMLPRQIEGREGAQMEFYRKVDGILVETSRLRKPRSSVARHSGCRRNDGLDR